MSELPLLLERLRRPLLVSPAATDAVVQLVNERPATPSASRFVGTDIGPRGARRTYRVQGRVAIVDVVGGLVNRGAWLGEHFCTGLVSYEGIAAQIREVAADKDVDAVILDIDSPGGEAAGVFTLADSIRSLRGIKPVVAVINDTAASAGYALAASASEIVVSPTSIVGSIGVVYVHLDRSRQVDRSGVTPTLLYAGEHKIDGTPFAPLSDSARIDLEKDLAAVYRRFLESVAAGRGRRLSAKAAQKTEAKVFRGGDAIAAGLADRLGTLDDVLVELSRSRSGSPKTQKTKEPKQMFGDPDPAALAAARLDERKRIKTILTSSSAEGRQRTAMAFALDTDMSPEAAERALADVPANAEAAIPAPDARQMAVEFGASAASHLAGGRGQAQAGWKKAFGQAATK